MFKMMLIVLSLVLVGNVKAAEDQVLESLNGIYAVSFKNNWKKITKKTEDIIDNYKKFKDLDKTLQQLDLLEDIVLSNDLNENKVEAFFIELDATRENIEGKKALEKQASITVPRPLTLVPPIIHTPYTTRGKFSLLLGLSILLIAFLVYAYIYLTKKMMVDNQSRALSFESSLPPGYLEQWNGLKKHFMLVDGLNLDASIYDLGEVVSLEFSIIKSLKKIDICNITKAVKQQNAQILIVSEIKGGRISSRQLVVNFTIQPPLLS